MNSLQKKHPIELIDSIKVQLEKLVNYEQEAPLIEVDIVKENLRNLYEMVDNMFSSSNDFIQPEVAVDAVDKEIEDLLNEASKEFKQEVDTQIKEQEEILDEQLEAEDEKPEVLKENIEEIAAAIEDEIEAVKEEMVEEPKIETPKPPKIAKAEKPSVDKAENVDKSKKIVHVLDVEADEEDDEEEEKSLMGQKLKKKAIKSLKQGIGINDKFMIINDLFEGRAKDFNAAIKELDNQKDRQSAIFLLEDMKDENLWESKDSAYIQFKSYIERRYM
jgi:hypothetical protein